MDQSVNGLAWCATQVNETTGETMNGRWSDCRSEACPIECTCPEEELSLVCGQDGVTYSSECAARCEKVALDYPGECLPKGGQCRFSQDCRNFSSCSSRQDASCVCVHGTCETKVSSRVNPDPDQMSMFVAKWQKVADVYQFYLFLLYPCIPATCHVEALAPNSN